MTDVLTDSFASSKNELASCAVLKHAHSSTEKLLHSHNNCKYRTNTADNNSFESLHSVFVCNVQEISASETPFNTNRIEYNFVLFVLICASFKN